MQLPALKGGGADMRLCFAAGSDPVKAKSRRCIMSKKKYKVRAECPQCACGTVSHLSPETLREKFIGDEKETC